MAILLLVFKIKIQVWLMIVTCCGLVLSGCGSDNIAKPHTPLTTAEKAMESLRAENYTAAIELFQAAIAEDPLNYQLFRYLATAMAVVSGFDLFAVLANQFEGEEGNNLLATLGLFLPSDPSPDQLNLLAQSIDLLLSIPVSYRDPAISTETTAKSITIQIALYQTGYSLMYLNRFNQKNSDGSLDQDRLASMSDEDAEAIISSLQAVAASTGNSALAEEVDKIIDDIDNQEGESQRERLIQYIVKKS